MTGVRHVEESEHKRSNPASILVMVNIPKICQVSRDLLTLCLECPYNSEGETMFWRFAFQDPSDLRQVMENLNRVGIRTRLKELAPIDERPTLTTRQSQVINAAMKRGYYEFPREISLTELSQALEVKPSTLSEILRSAERRILQNATHAPAHLNHAREYTT
jgi:predicted DNA binding protein